MSGEVNFKGILENRANTIQETIMAAGNEVNNTLSSVSIRYQLSTEQMLAVLAYCNFTMNMSNAVSADVSKASKE